MSEKDKVEEPSLGDIVDSALGDALRGCCLEGIVNNKPKIDMLNSILDASIKFHQLVLIAIQRRDVEASIRAKEAAMQVKAAIQAKEGMLTAKAD